MSNAKMAAELTLVIKDKRRPSNKRGLRYYSEEKSYKLN